MEVWIGRDGERHGPYQEAEIRDWLRTGQISPDDLAWYEGLSDWQPLRSLFPADAPQQQPPPLLAPLPKTAAPEVVDLAGFWHRFAAWLLDYIVLLVPMLVAYYGMHIDRVTQAMVDLIKASGSFAAAQASPSFAGLASQFQPFWAVYVIIGFAYYTAMEGSRWQTTLGKRAVGLKVTDLKGQRLSWRRAAMRNAVRLINMVTALLPLAFYLPAAWTQRHQGLHDMLASSLVVNGRGSPEPVREASPDRDFDI